MKTATITLNDIKDSDGWYGLAHDVAFEKFKKEHPELIDDEDDDKLNDAFATQVIYKTFQYGEYGNIEIVVDENFNIVGGKIIPFEK